jgi:hypothetical protein
MADNAPYKIVKAGDKFNVVNNAGIVKASFDSEEKARSYQKALYANVPGAAKAADRKPWTGNAPLKASALDRIAQRSGLFVELFNPNHDTKGEFSFGGDVADKITALPQSPKDYNGSDRPQVQVGGGVSIAKDTAYPGGRRRDGTIVPPERQTFSVYHKSDPEEAIGQLSPKDNGRMALIETALPGPIARAQRAIVTDAPSMIAHPKVGQPA